MKKIMFILGYIQISTQKYDIKYYLLNKNVTFNIIIVKFINILIKVNLINLLRSMHSPVSHMRTQDSMGKTNFNHMSSTADLQKVIKALQKMAIEQRQKRQAAQQQLSDFKVRTIRRETQLCDLVTKLNDYKTKVLNQNPEITKLFSSIWHNFDLFNQKSMEIISKSYEENLQSFDRKIKNIILVTKEQIQNYAKKYNLNFNIILNDIQNLCETAIKIQQRNQQMALQVKKLQFQVKILKQEKYLAIQDALQRKAKVALLTQQNKKLNEQLQKDNGNGKILLIKQQEKNLFQSERLQTRKQSTSPLAKKPTYKLYEFSLDKQKLSKNKSEAYSFESILQHHKLRMQTLQHFKDRDKKQTVFNQTIQLDQSNKSNKSRQYLLTTRNTVSPLNMIPKQAKLSIKKKYNRSLTKKFSNQSNIFQLEQNKFVAKNIQDNQNQNEKQTKIRQYHYLKTIQNLQQSLKRQKNKNLCLGTIVTKINNKSKQINQAFEQIIKQAQQSPNKLQHIHKSQKLFKTLKIIKQRLNAIETPLVNIGWGDSLASIK